MKKQVSLLFFLVGILFTSTLLISNILASKIIQIGNWEATAGILVFPVAYILNDVITEVWGYKKARIIIWTGFLMNLLMVGFITLAIKLKPAEYWNNQQAFSLILGQTPRIVFASLIAYLIGSLTNAYTLSKMKIAFKGERFSLRAITSTLFGEGIDSFLFIIIAFYGVYPISALFTMIAVQTALKTAYEILILPATIVIVNKIKRIERINEFDKHISFNPFNLLDI